MATTTSDVGSGVQMIALDRIRTDANIRELAPGDVDALAGSIALLGQITPAIVRPDGDQYVLVAGHKRYAAISATRRCASSARPRSARRFAALRASTLNGLPKMWRAPNLMPTRKPGRWRRCSPTA